MLESKSIRTGGPIRWRKDHYHLRHLNTGKDLSSSTHHDDYVVDSSNFVLCDHPNDKTCLFNFFELHSQNEHLQNNKAIQIRQGGMFIERDEYNDRWGVYVIKGNRNRLRATNLIITRYSEEARTKAGEVAVALDTHIGMSFYNLIRSFYNHTVIPSVRDDRASSIWPDIEGQDRLAYGAAMTSLLSFLKGEAWWNPPSV